MASANNVHDGATANPDEYIYYVFVEHFARLENTDVGDPQTTAGDAGEDAGTSTELSSGPYTLVKNEWSKGVCLGPFVLNEADQAERRRLSVKHNVNVYLAQKVHLAVDDPVKLQGPFITEYSNKESKAQVEYEPNPDIAVAKRNPGNRPLTLYMVMGIRMPIPPFDCPSYVSRNYIVGAVHTRTLERKIETFLDKDEALARGEAMTREYRTGYGFEEARLDRTPPSTEFPCTIAVGNGMAAGTLLPGMVTVVQQQFR
jgi:hypothetical protein